MEVIRYAEGERVKYPRHSLNVDITQGRERSVEVHVNCRRTASARKAAGAHSRAAIRLDYQSARADERWRKGRIKFLERAARRAAERMASAAE